MKKLFILLLIAVFPATAMSGTATGKIIQVLAHTQGGNGQGVFMFQMDGQRTNPPACSTVGGGKAWAMRLDAESGRAMYALALSALSQGKKVSVSGTGNCNSWGDREEPVYMRVFQ